jgi:hypothetical protein
VFGSSDEIGHVLWHRRFRLPLSEFCYVAVS